MNKYLCMVEWTILWIDSIIRIIQSSSVLDIQLQWHVHIGFCLLSCLCCPLGIWLHLINGTSVVVDAKIIPVNCLSVCRSDVMGLSVYLSILYKQSSKGWAVAALRWPPCGLSIFAARGPPRLALMPLKTSSHSIEMALSVCLYVKRFAEYTPGQLRTAGGGDRIPISLSRWRPHLLYSVRRVCSRPVTNKAAFHHPSSQPLLTPPTVNHKLLRNIVDLIYEILNNNNNKLNIKWIRENNFFFSNEK